VSLLPSTISPAGAVPMRWVWSRMCVTVPASHRCSRTWLGAPGDVLRTDEFGWGRKHGFIQCGHWSQVERAVEFNEIVGNYLTRHADAR